jgi:oligosaccharide translocation protein RFT1
MAGKYVPGRDTAAHRPGLVEGPTDAAPHGGSKIEQSVAMLQTLHRFVLLIAAVALVFGPAYAFAAVHLLLSHRWSSTEAPALLALYCIYLLFLAVNGVAEAYTHARMSSKELSAANGFLAAVTLTQAAAMVAARGLGLGCNALVVLDAASMAVRIVYAYRYIHRNCAGNVGKLSAWVPAAGSWAALGLTAAVLHASKVTCSVQLTSLDLAGGPRFLRPLQLHVARGLGILALLLLVLCWTERGLIRSVRALTKEHQA